MKQALNLSEKLYIKEGSNEINPRYKNYGKIMKLLKNQIDKMMVYDIKRVDKRFNISHLVPTEQGVFVGDEAGRIYNLIESSFSNFVTTHKMRISSMYIDLTKKILITASESKDIKITDTVNYSTKMYLTDIPAIVRCITLDTESDILFAGLDNGYVISYNIVDGETNLILMCNSSNTPISSVSLNADKSVLFSSDIMGNIYFWDLETPLLMKVIQLSNSSINYILFNHSENSLYVTDYAGKIMVWNIIENRKVFEFGINDIPITKLIICENKSLIIGCNIEGSVILWDLETKGFVKYFRDFQLNGLKDIALSIDESKLYTVGNSDHVENWDFDNNVILTRLYTNEIFDDELYSLAFSTSSKIFCISHTNNVLIYNIKSYNGTAEICEQFFIGNRSKFTSLYIVEELCLMYLGCSDGQVQVWNYETKNYIISYNCAKNPILSLLVVNDHNYLFCGDSKGLLHMWDLKSDTKLAEITDTNKAALKFIFITNDDLYLVIGKEDGIIQLRNIELGNIVYDTSKNQMADFSSYCKASDSDIFYTISDNRFLIQWRIVEETITSKIVLDRQNLDFKNITCDSTGSLLFAVTNDNKIKVYNDNYPLSQNFNVKLSVDVAYVSLTTDTSTLFILANDGSLFYVHLFHKHDFDFFSKTDNVKATCICADDNNAYIGNNNGYIDVWHLSTKDLFIKLKAKSSKVNCLLPSSRGPFLYSGHEDGGIVIWNTENYKFIREIRKQEGGIISMIMNQDQKLLLSAAKDNKIFIWDLKNFSFKYWIETQFEPEKIYLAFEDKYLVTVLTTGQVALYNLAGENIGYIGHRTSTLRSTAISKDGNKIYIAYEEGPIQIWDMSDFEAIGTLYKPKMALQAMNISNDGNRMYLITRNAILSIIDINTRTLIKEINFNESFRCNYIYLSPNNNLLFGLGKRKTLVVDITDNYSYYEKLYIGKALKNYNSTNAESDFLTTLEYVKDHYNSSFVLRTYFNAVFICALFNYQRAIQIIQRKHISTYPQDNDHNQISPIVLALKLRNLNLVQLVLKNIAKYAINFTFSYREIKELLRAKYGFTHKYIKDFVVELKNFTDSTIKVPILSRIDEEVRIEYDLNLFFSEKRFEKMTEPRYLYYKKDTFNFDQALKQVKSNLGKKQDINASSDSVKTNELVSIEKFQYMVKEDKVNNPEKQNKAPWNPTKLYRLNAYYSFKEGSSDSLFFLKNYIESSSSDFILSNWKYIIDYKWHLIYWYLIPPAMLNFSHAVFYSLYLISPGIYSVFLADAIIIGILVLYELVSLSITGREHFNDFYNVLDSIFLSFTAAIFSLTRYFIVEKQETGLIWLKYLQVLTLFMVYYRSVTYLRVIKYFRHIIDMIIGVTGSTISLLIIIGYAIFAFAILFKKSIGSASFILYLKENFYNLHGELMDYEEEGRGITTLGWIVFTANVLFVPLILINFMVAKMNNKYTELESKEKVTSYQEKAKMIMEIEFYFRLRNRVKDYKYFTFIARKASKLRDTEENIDEKIEDNIENLHNKMNEIRKIRRKEIKRAVKRHNDLEHQIKDILMENNQLKNQLSSIKEENLELKNLFLERNNQIESKIGEVNKKLSTLADISTATIRETK